MARWVRCHGGLVVVENLVEDKPMDFPISPKRFRNQHQQEPKTKGLHLLSQFFFFEMDPLSAHVCLGETWDHHFSARASRARTLKTTDENAVLVLDF
jgi:hypothetical protein